MGKRVRTITSGCGISTVTVVIGGVNIQPPVNVPDSPFPTLSPEVDVAVCAKRAPRRRLPAQTVPAAAGGVGLPLTSGSDGALAARSGMQFLGRRPVGFAGHFTPRRHRHGSAHLPAGPGGLSPGPHGVPPFACPFFQAGPRASDCTFTGQAITLTSMNTDKTPHAATSRNNELTYNDA